MPGLPRISGREAVAAFQRAGFRVSRQRASHIVLTKSVPDHRELAAGTLRALIRKAGLTVGRFEELLHE